MKKRTIGIVLIFIGAIISLVATGADLIGLGKQPGIGWQQLLLLVVGIYISLYGFWQSLNKPNQ